MAINYEVTDGILRINCKNWVVAPSVEDSDATMAVVIDTLMKTKANRVILSEAKEVEYDYEQTAMLREIADAYETLVNNINILDPKKMGVECIRKHPERLSKIRLLIMTLLKHDPIAVYLQVLSTINKLKPSQDRCDKIYIENILKPIETILGKCKLIEVARPFFNRFRLGDRGIYREIFFPIIRPNFMLTRFIFLPPRESTLLDRYTLPNKTLVEIYKVPKKVRYLYHIIAPEFKLSEEKCMLLDRARRYLAEHKPSETEISEPEKARAYFKDVGKDLIKDLARGSGISLTSEELEELAAILTRYTAGFGVVELLLADDRIQDIYVNSPVGLTPIFVNHSDFEECETNLIPTREEAEGWATKFRLYSGRPLDESNPVLDTEIITPGGMARVAAITRSLSHEGLAFTFRRHREKPWTFPLFINLNYFNSLYAGLMSFIIDGGRSILVAGGRGSGKTSLLGSMMLEIMRKFRIVVQQDTLELPIVQLRNLGYNIESLKSRSVITQVKTELSAEEALRTALRLGDSVLIIGEVRSREATALFEAMRIGALANLVAGTIHGESVYGVYDRVVHDLGVVPTSFKALDLITIANFLRSPDGLHRFRRVVELTEVRKHWKEDPLEEGGFVTLMEYSAKEDTLKPTDTLIDGESYVLNEIAKRVKEWRGSWELVWENIQLRSKIKQTIVDYSKELNRPEILEADWTVACNEMFHEISDKVREEVGYVDPKLVYERWLEWFKSKLRLKS